MGSPAVCCRALPWRGRSKQIAHKARFHSCMYTCFCKRIANRHSTATPRRRPTAYASNVFFYRTQRFFSCRFYELRYACHVFGVQKNMTRRYCFRTVIFDSYGLSESIFLACRVGQKEAISQNCTVFGSENFDSRAPLEHQQVVISCQKSEMEGQGRNRDQRL